MSKPSDIKYSLANWSIRYDPRDYEGNFEASVTWSADVNGIKPIRHHKNCNGFEAAKAWIEEETGLKFK
jgi:hypothetical protein